MREIERGVPGEVPSLDWCGIDAEFDTYVVDFTNVCVDLIKWEDIFRDRVVPDQVFGVLVIELHAAIDAAIEESVVNTYVEHTSGFPFQVRIGQLGGTEDDIVRAIKGIITVRTAVGGDG